MVSDNRELIELIKQMDSNHEKAYARTEDHLSHLRTNVHNLVNELGGVSQLTHILHEDLTKVKADHKSNMNDLSKKIGAENASLELKVTQQLEKTEKRVKAVENAIEEIKPKADRFGKLSDNVAKVLVTVIASVILSSLALVWNWKSK